MLKTYAHHTPPESAIPAIYDLRSGFSAVQELIERSVPNVRERAVAITYLETAAMWAIKALVVHNPESKVEDDG